MLILNESNFNDALKENPKLLVLFYREKGCAFCDKMKPIFEAHGESSEEVCGMYRLGNAPDSVATAELVKSFPTIAAYQNGQLVNVEAGANVDLKKMFVPKNVPVSQASLAQLMVDEAALIDAIYPMKLHLEEIQKEIKRRREFV
jgi:thiol-disulfide isomerase/thioredoxin